MKKVDFITRVLLIVGGLNWLLVGASRFDLVAAVFGMGFGQTNVLSAIVYVLVGLSALAQAGVLLGLGAPTKGSNVRRVA